jgi:hypothetical protein
MSVTISNVDSEVGGWAKLPGRLVTFQSRDARARNGKGIERYLLHLSRGESACIVVISIVVQDCQLPRQIQSHFYFLVASLQVQIKR